MGPIALIMPVANAAPHPPGHVLGCCPPQFNKKGENQHKAIPRAERSRLASSLRSGTGSVQ